MRFVTHSGLMAAALVLAGCTDGLQRYTGDPNSVIATAYDKGRDAGVLTDGGAAIAYDPDGCQGWIIDDGLDLAHHRVGERADVPYLGVLGVKSVMSLL